MSFFGADLWSDVFVLFLLVTSFPLATTRTHNPQRCVYKTLIINVPMLCLGATCTVIGDYYVPMDKPFPACQKIPFIKLPLIQDRHLFHPIIISILALQQVTIENPCHCHSHICKLGIPFLSQIIKILLQKCSNVSSR